MSTLVVHVDRPTVRQQDQSQRSHKMEKEDLLCVNSTNWVYPQFTYAPSLLHNTNCIRCWVLHTSSFDLGVNKYTKNPFQQCEQHFLFCVICANRIHSTHLNTLDVVQPFELMPNPFYCREFLRAAHHHKRLIFRWIIIIVELRDVWAGRGFFVRRR